MTKKDECGVRKRTSGVKEEEDTREEAQQARCIKILEYQPRAVGHNLCAVLGTAIAPLRAFVAPPLNYHNGPPHSHTTTTTATNVHFSPIIPGVNDHLAREELDGTQYHDEPREEARGEVLENGHLWKIGWYKGQWVEVGKT